MSNIQIVPIFDQGRPLIWDDFIHIRAAAMEFNYDYELETEEQLKILSEYQDEYKNKSYNFAFAAYDNTKMVGFIRGNGKNNTATIKCLYVLPAYQGQHIGRTLLQIAEYSIAPAYKNIELISLWHAENFYKHNQYTTINGVNKFSKTVTNAHCRDVPLFGFPACIAKQCANLLSAMPESVRIEPHAPLFSHFDENGKISGVLIANSDSISPVYLQTKNNSQNDWARLSLSRTYEKYRANIANLNTGRTK